VPDASSIANEPGALRALLSGLIDYAGLFPPAALELRDAVEAYDSHHRSADAWALGRFVLPATRLAEFDELARRVVQPELLGMWRLSALLNQPADLSLVRAHNERKGLHAAVDCVETRAAHATTIEALGALTGDLEAFVELSPTEDLDSLLAAVRRAGIGAKIRMGGVTTDAFPSASAVARFLVACRNAGVPMKATAGLHHALRGDYALTYEPNATRGTMFGWLNVVLAATAVYEGGRPPVVLALLEERHQAITFRDESVVWGEVEFAAATIARARKEFVRAIGSCSFREPLDDVRALLRSAHAE
jgi:hypothetical protein